MYTPEEGNQYGVIIIKHPDYYDSEPLAFNNTFFFEAYDPSKPCFLNHTFYLTPIDQTPPTTPEIALPEDGSVLTASPEITWTEAEDNSSVFYVLQVDGVNITVESTSYQTDLGAGAHTARVMAEDEFGNKGDFSELIAFTLDLEPPSITQINPEGEVQNPVTVGAKVTDDVGIEQANLSLDGTVVATELVADQLSYTTTLALGDHAAVVTATDLAGRTSEKEWTFKVVEEECTTLRCRAEKAIIEAGSKYEEAKEVVTSRRGKLYLRWAKRFLRLAENELKIGDIVEPEWLKNRFYRRALRHAEISKSLSERAIQIG